MRLVLVCCALLGLSAAVHAFGDAEELVSAIAVLEKAHPDMGWKDMATKLRKRYYDDAAIPGQPSRKEKVMKKLGMTPWDLLIPARSNIPRFEEAKETPEAREALNKFVTKKAEVSWEPQGIIDLGHTFAGIDSVNFPKASRLAKALFGFRRGTGPATWSGDTGSAVTEWATQRKHNPKVDRETIYQRMNSVADHLGNLDGIAIGYLNANEPDSAKLSTMVSRYYTRDQWRTQRYLSFLAGEFGAKDISPSVRTVMHREILLFARGYYAKSNLKEVAFNKAKNMANKLNPWGDHNPVFPWTDVEFEWFVDRFIKDVQALKQGGILKPPSQ